jgi:hypothetical protein
MSLVRPAAPSRQRPQYQRRFRERLPECHAVTGRSASACLAGPTLEVSLIATCTQTSSISQNGTLAGMGRIAVLPTAALQLIAPYTVRAAMDLGGLLTACSGGPWGCRRAVLTQCSRCDQASTPATSSFHRAAALWSLVPAVLPVRTRSPLCAKSARPHMDCTSSRVQHDVARRSRRSGGGGACRRAPCGHLPARHGRQTGGADRARVALCSGEHGANEFPGAGRRHPCRGALPGAGATGGGGERVLGADCGAAHSAASRRRPVVARCRCAARCIRDVRRCGGTARPRARARAHGTRDTGLPRVEVARNAELSVEADPTSTAPQARSLLNWQIAVTGRLAWRGGNMTCTGAAIAVAAGGVFESLPSSSPLRWTSNGCSLISNGTIAAELQGATAADVQLDLPLTVGEQGSVELQRGQGTGTGTLRLSAFSLSGQARPSERFRRAGSLDRLRLAGRRRRLLVPALERPVCRRQQQRHCWARLPGEPSRASWRRAVTGSHAQALDSGSSARTSGSLTVASLSTTDSAIQLLSPANIL